MGTVPLQRYFVKWGHLSGQTQQPPNALLRAGVEHELIAGAAPFGIQPERVAQKRPYH
jgi:hypothetical protein